MVATAAFDRRRQPARLGCGAADRPHARRHGCVVALHNGTSAVGKRPPKLGFWAIDIAAARQQLINRGAKMSKLMEGGGLVRCEGKDPDGNPFSISDRK
jgi:hypothetical protein